MEIARYMGRLVPEEQVRTAPCSGRKNRNSLFNADFLNEMRDSGTFSCIICPKGCFLKEGVYGCGRGESYYRSLAAGSVRQKFTTTLTVEKSVRHALVSKENLSVTSQAGLGARLKDPSEASSFFIEHPSEITPVFL